MTLEKAILFAIETEGIEIISETRFVNYLSDLQAFDKPAVKHIVGTMVTGGYSEKLKHSLSTQNYELDINDTKNKLVTIEGYQADLVNYVLNCLLFATKKTTQAPVMPATEASPSVTNPLDPTGESIYYHFPTLDLLSDIHALNPDDYYNFLPLRSALAARLFQESRYELPICLGVTEQDDVYVVDLAKLPHLLIAGSTGTGKSVFIHSIISSLLYKLGPTQLKFVLIDQHRVELSIYSEIDKYFLAKSEYSSNAVLSNPDDVGLALQSLIQEIEHRFQLLERASSRDIIDYNTKWRQTLRSERDEHGVFKFEYLPRIVVIIDEFASYSQNIPYFQTLISQIASKGRATGVHLSLSTNAVGARILTQSIKSLFPARVAFNVPQAHESILIIDSGGAEKLNHKGRIIFKCGDTETCLQSPYVDVADTMRLCEFIKLQEDADSSSWHECYELGHPIYEPIVKKQLPNELDPLFEQCARWIVQSDTASTSALQRRYEIGYNRAGRIMDQLEAAGIVGHSNGGRPRKVLLSPMDIDQMLDGGQQPSKPVAQPMATPNAKPIFNPDLTTVFPSYNGGTSVGSQASNTPQNAKKSSGNWVMNIILIILAIIIMCAFFFAK